MLKVASFLCCCSKEDLNFKCSLRLLRVSVSSIQAKMLADLRLGVPGSYGCQHKG